MTYLVERLSELRRHLDHLREIRPRVTGREALERDLSLHNDVLSRTTPRRSAAWGATPDSRPSWRKLERLPGFRNVVILRDLRFDARAVHHERAVRQEDAEGAPRLLDP